MLCHFSLARSSLVVTGDLQQTGVLMHIARENLRCKSACHMVPVAFPHYWFVTRCSFRIRVARTHVNGLVLAWWLKLALMTVTWSP